MWYVVQVLGGQEKATLELVEHALGDDGGNGGGARSAGAAKAVPEGAVVYSDVDAVAADGTSGAVGEADEAGAANATRPVASATCEAGETGVDGMRAPGQFRARPFIPQREIMRHRGGEWVKGLELLFPGYLFVDTRDPDALLERLAQVPAFTRLLGSEAAFVPLAPAEKAAIRAMIGERGVARMSEGIIEGGEVRILSGPLRDQDATIVKIDRHKRCAYVRVRMLGRDVDVKLGLEIMRKSA